MADIRCPMCGKVNPSELQVCQFCDARLIPLIAQTPPENEPLSEPSDEEGANREPATDMDWTGQEESTPDWLTNLRQEDDSQPAETPSEEEADSVPSVEEDEAADWLSRLDEGAEEEDLAKTEEAGPDFEEGEAADWLSRLEEGPQEDETLDTDDTSFDFEDGATDWLSRLEDQPEEDNGPQSEEQTGESGLSADEDLEEEEIPDWLRQIQAEDEQPASDQTSDSCEGEIESWGEETEREAKGDSEELPAWLSGAADEPDWFPQEQSAEEEEAFDIEEADLEETAGREPKEETSIPEWLSEMQTEDEDWSKIEEHEEPLEFELDEAEPEEVSEFKHHRTEEAATPDWLSEMAPQTPSEMEDQEEPSAIESEQAEPEIVEQVPFESFDEDDLEGFLAEEFPSDWYPEETEGGSSVADEEVDAEVSRAEIPSWLESMRPVEDAAPEVTSEEEEEQQVESAGPLAGLSGVLSAEPEIARVQKPPAYSVKLQVSENQSAHADLLRDMIAEEGQPKPISRPASISPQHLLRWAIGLILISAVLWQVLSGTQEASLPTFTTGTAAVNQLINQLPNQAKVLLAFDYEPGLSGEMDAVAAPVVDHLMLRGAYLTLVSTSPMGPFVAERFLATTQTEHNYASPEQYVNLGFIPGGPAGLLSFAETPQRILPYTLDGQRAWRGGLQPLQGIQQLSDYSLVMVISDNPIVARTWVEQVEPYLETESSRAPLVMITSAQAEPLVRPYYQSSEGQIQGLISGLRDGGSYALLTGRGGLPRKYWDAFSLGLWIAAALVAIGGLINLALLVLERSKKS